MRIVNSAENDRNIFKYTVFLPVESAHTRITLLGVDIIGFVFDIMVTLDVFPVCILGLEYLPDAGFEYERRVDTGCPRSIQYCIELDAAVTKMPDNRQVIFLLLVFAVYAAFLFLHYRSV